MADNIVARDGEKLRIALIAAAQRLIKAGLTRNTSGNLGRRVDGGLLITPSGIDYDRLEPADIVFVAWDGTPTGRRLPSSEWRIHRDIMQSRPEVVCVLHAHPPFATSLACLREGIPPFHYMVAKAGGPDIRCAPYATYGTAELSAHALTALEGRRACLLANHGIIVAATDLDAAVTLGIEVETLAEMYLRARQIGTPVLLDGEEMAVVVEKFRSYGYQPPLNDQNFK